MPVVYLEYDAKRYGRYGDDDLETEIAFTLGGALYARKRAC
jgi:hypothetical protein